jgi:hypothetical protein
MKNGSASGDEDDLDKHVLTRPSLLSRHAIVFGMNKEEQNANETEEAQTESSDAVLKLSKHYGTIPCLIIN